MQNTFARLKHWARYFWALDAHVSLGRAIVCVTVGVLVGGPLLRLLHFDPLGSYLWSAYLDPDFQNRLAFSVTFGIALLTASFTFGFAILELALWVTSMVSWGYRSGLRKVRKELNRLKPSNDWN
jgi:hypothetical protein